MAIMKKYCKLHVIIFIMVTIYFIYDFTMKICFRSDSPFLFSMYKTFFWASHLRPYQYPVVGAYLYGTLLAGLVYCIFFSRSWIVKSIGSLMFCYFLFFWVIIGAAN